MVDDKALALAKETFNTLCDAFLNQGYKYTVEGDTKLSLNVMRPEFPYKMFMHVDPETYTVTVFSKNLARAHYSVVENKNLLIALTNYIIPDGYFYYDDGCSDWDMEDIFDFDSISFKLETSFYGAELSEEALLDLLTCAVTTMNRYGSKLKMLTEGTVSQDEYIKFLSQQGSACMFKRKIKTNDPSWQIYEKICTVLGRIKWSYDRSDKNMAVKIHPVKERHHWLSSMEPLNEMTVWVDPESKTIRLETVLPFRIMKEAITEVAILTFFKSNSRPYGKFVLDIQERRVSFRVSAFYNNSEGVECLTEHLLSTTYYALYNNLDDFEKYKEQ